MLYRNAEAKGAVCRDQTRVLDILQDEDRVTGVTIRTDGCEQESIGAKVVVDATGQSTLIASRLKIRDDDPQLRKAAIWTYYKNADRDPGEHGGATIIMHTKTKESWFWFIPLRDNVTSIGVVADNDYLLKGRGKPEEVFAEELAACSALQKRLESAEVVEQYRVAKEFSYTTRQQAGPGWVLVVDAFGFIDPIYSSGVYFALKSGEWAADAIVEAAKNNDFSAEQLGRWIGEFKSGTQWIRKLVDAYYTNEFSFGYFLKNHPQYTGNLTDLLIGRIFHHGAGDIFDDMDPALKMAREGVSS